MTLRALTVATTRSPRRGGRRRRRTARRSTGTTGPGFSITLTSGGTRVTKLDPGPYELQVDDRSEEHNFHLQGPGVDVRTAIENIERKTFQVNARRTASTRSCATRTQPGMSGIVHGRQRHRAAAERPPPTVKPSAPVGSRLILTSGPGFSITLKTVGGKKVTRLKPGALHDRRARQVLGPQRPDPRCRTDDTRNGRRQGRDQDLEGRPQEGHAHLPVRPAQGVDARHRRRSRRSYRFLPPTSQVVPCVPTLSTSESTRSTETPPVIPASSRRVKQTRGHPGRHAVARAARAAEREPDPVAIAGRVDRRAEQRGAGEQRARVDVEDAEQLRPVGRERARARRPSSSAIDVARRRRTVPAHRRRSSTSERQRSPRSRARRASRTGGGPAPGPDSPLTGRCRTSRSPSRPRSPGRARCLRARRPLAILELAARRARRPSRRAATPGSAATDRRGAPKSA